MGSPVQAVFRRARAHEWTLLAAVFFAAVVVADLLSGPTDNINGLFAVVPTLLALEWAWGVVVVASLPLVLLVATNLFGADYGTPGGSVTARLVGLGLGILVGVYISVTRERRASTLARTREAAEAAQRAILPVVPDRIGALRFAALYRSASEEALVGGDLYAVVPTPFGVRILVGDVQGKGIDAVSLSSAVLGCFREWAPETAALRDLVARLDDRVTRSARRGEFVTAVVATIEEDADRARDVGDLTVEIANCGHPAPMLFSAGTEVPLVPDRRAVPLGMEPEPSLSRVHLHSGDRLLFYTDALTEARDQDGRFIPFEDVLGDLPTHRFDSALDDLLLRLEARAGRLRDDSATLLVECGAPGEAGLPAGERPAGRALSSQR